MSKKKDLFTQIGAYLMANLQFNQTITPDNPAPLPNLAWVDKQMGQFSKPDQFYAIPLPCVLMEYQPFTWVTIGKNQQRGTGTIRFYLYFENYADSFTGSANADLALRFFDYNQQLNQLLQGFSLNGMTPLERVADNEDHAQDMIITSIADYSTVITDTSTDTERKNVLIDPVITVDRVKTTTRPPRAGFCDNFLP